jgi:hypothetical protein
MAARAAPERLVSPDRTPLCELEDRIAQGSHRLGVRMTTCGGVIAKKALNWYYKDSQAFLYFLEASI